MISVFRKGLVALSFCSALVLQAEISLPVTTDTYGIISGRTLVYQDYTYLTGTMYYASVFVYDLDSGTKTAVLPADNSTPYYIYYGFDNGHLPYMSLSGSGGGGMMKSTQGGPGGVSSYIDYLNTRTGTTQRLVSDTAYKEILWIGGGKLVWVDYRHKTSTNVNGEVYMLPIGGSEQRLTETAAYEGEPFTDGDRVVWTEYSQGSIGNIEMLTLSSGERTIIDPQPTHQGSPRVHGDWVVWVDYRNTGSDAKNGDIYAHRISSGETKAICTAPKFQGRPFVHNGFLVWEDFRNATTDTINADIYGYDLETNESYSLVVENGYQGRPTTYGDTICYISNVGSEMNLKVTSLTEISEAVPVTSQKTSILQTEGRLFLRGNLLQFTNSRTGDRIELYDTRGSMVAMGTGVRGLDLSSIPAGFYSVSLRRNGRLTTAQPLVVR